MPPRPDTGACATARADVRAVGGQGHGARGPPPPRWLAARDTRGFVKLVADAATRKIVGAHILAAEAGEM
ncbi:MAG: hypothetical protein HY704_06640, partial [Gemmatimonadetes bacterium]|nr:hypothetical protein [Gemmatimonadota bacterium]